MSPMHIFQADEIVNVPCLHANTDTNFLALFNFGNHRAKVVVSTAYKPTVWNIDNTVHQVPCSRQNYKECHKN